MFFLLISINKHSNSPKGITNKEIQPSSKGFPNAKKIKLSGTKIRSAKSIKGKKTLKHAKNLDFIDIFLDDNILSVNINRLRNKAKEIGITDFLTNVRGKGYKL